MTCEQRFGTTFNWYFRDERTLSHKWHTKRERWSNITIQCHSFSSDLSLYVWVFFSDSVIFRLVFSSSLFDTVCLWAKSKVNIVIFAIHATTITTTATATSIQFYSIRLNVFEFDFMQNTRMVITHQHHHAMVVV